MGLRFVNYNNERFLIAHFQGHSYLGHSPAVMTFNTAAIKVPEDITIITFASFHSENPLLPAQLDNAGVPYLNPAKDIKAWHNPMKIPLTVQALTQVATEYALILDGTDVLLTGDISDIARLLHESGYRVVFGATKSNYPNILIDKVRDRDWFGDYRYLNAGTAFGKTADLSAFYTRANRIQDEIENPYNSEQYVIRKTFAEDTETVGFDYKCRIFQTFGKAEIKQTGDTVCVY